ncbi:replication initiation factor domain-containing protein [Oryzisolibacter sp. LB2S]|uniref:replication initiation factor domain-containing protein n=1 Tax=Alicycliphilus soli TaxID=3228789 RepID=UPI003458D725
MTRPAGTRLNKHSKTCALVLDGSEVKARLMIERRETKMPVHVDWVRFTALVRNAPTPEVDVLFPEPVELLSLAEQDESERRKKRLRKMLAELPDPQYAPGGQALELAEKVASILGDEFVVVSELRKGHDFYAKRISIERHGSEVGWVGFGASGDSPRQKAQSQTLHVNLYGTACTFAKAGWRDAIADLVDELDAKITRVDLALDFFDGLAGGMRRIKADYEHGLMDCGGKRPKCNMVGDWSNGPVEGKGRSFYIGSKEAGKQTNVYEKGHQLFGEKDASGWIRAELRFGNKLRVLPSDLLRYPASGFAGASDWHAALLNEAGATVDPFKVPCEKRLAAETIEAEVTRNVRWVRDVAGASLSLAFQYLGENAFLEIVNPKAVPGRLRRFSRDEIRCAYEKAHGRVYRPAGTGQPCVTA